ncbi:general substrate transporter [Mycena amicta]|nr:general substrate transporter [Mycena amicta]
MLRFESAVQKNEQLGYRLGCINSAPSIIGLFSTWLADPLNNIVGRRGTVFVTGLFCVFPVLGQAFTRNWYELLICRLLMGFGMGIKITTIPLYSAETVPASIRGGLVMSFQLWVAFGIFIGFLLKHGILSHRSPSMALPTWRGLRSCRPAPPPRLVLPRVTGVVAEEEAVPGQLQKSFARLRNSELQAARDLYYAYVQHKAEAAAFAGSTFFRRVHELFTVPRLHRAALGGFLVMAAQQFSGINIMSFYSSTIFSEGGYDTRTQLCLAFPAIWTIDTFGRRNLLLFTFPNMAWALFVAAGLFKLPNENGARLPLIATFTFIFTAFYSPGIGPVPNVYSSECFPLSHREVGSSWSIFVNNFLSTILGLTFPSMLAKFEPTDAFCFYGALNLTAFVLIFFLLPETKQRTLKELDYIFAVPTRTHANYQLTTWLPWFVKRYVFWQKEARLEPLYQLDGVVGEGEGTKMDYFH